VSASLNIIELMNDRALVGGAYAGDTWRVWRSVLKATFALPMADDELEIFRSVAGNRNVPQRRVRELWAVVGRRGGKDSAAALIALHAALLVAPTLFRRPGERLTSMCLACDRSQAAILLGYIKGLLYASALLKPLIISEDSESILLEGGVELIVATNSYRAVRGRTLICAAMDEVGFFRSEDSALPDFETFNALLPGLATTGGMLVGISSPYRRSGLIFERWRDYFGQDDDDILVVHGASKIFNPTLDQRIIDDALARDPAAASAEWLAEWRTDISGFLDGQWIDRAASLEPGELPPQPGKSYRCFIDPSGGRSDAMTLAIAHLEDDDRVIVDLVRGRRAPFDPASVVAEFSQVARAYGCSQATADRYAGEWPVSAFADHGISIRAAELSKSEIYLECEPLFARGAIAIPADRVLLAELRQLERRTHRGGKDSVDHFFGGHDDYANACCGAAFLCAGSGMQGARFLDFWTSSVACAAGDKAAIAARAERVAAARARNGARSAATKAPPPQPVRMRSMKPYANFCTSDGTRYSSGGDCLITAVAPQHVEHMRAMLCTEV
jgi:hypothetical protein